MLHRQSPEPAVPAGAESKTGAGWVKPVIAAMGPLGHLYMDRSMDDPERSRLARALVERAQIPMVSVAEGPDRARVWTRRGRFALPEDASAVFTPDHPFLGEMTQDFIALCHHQNAGDFVLWGWSRDERPVTFPIENGSHAGPGPEETHAFVLLPEDVPRQDAKGYWRPLDLREAALEHLGRSAVRRAATARAFASGGRTLRVMTYNVHSCVGVDGKLSPRRIARVISRYSPDVVALQEVDVGRLRTQGVDQARIIADYLRMEHQFNPTIEVEEEAYGDCVLSRLPMRLVKAGMLPPLREGDSREPRGAVWVAVDLGGRLMHLVNTHLGLNRRERLRQIRALLGDQWLGDLDHSEPAVLCGDFNATPYSHVWKLCAKAYRDVQTGLAHYSPRCTWFSHYPVIRIDHIFVSPGIRVVCVDVGNDYLARVASDHRPLLAELRL